jgi:hypothetical protein
MIGAIHGRRLVLLVASALLSTAFGSSPVGLGASPRPDPVPGSIPGQTWSRVSLDRSIADGARMTDVTVGGPGFVAVGVDRKDVPVAWTSPDGLSWERHVLPRSLELMQPIGNAWDPDGLSGPIVASHDGTLTVLDRGSTPEGFAVSGFGARHLWTSPDGVEWTLVPSREAGLDPEPKGGIFGMAPGPLLDLTADGTGFVAVGSSEFNGRTVPQIARSADGLAWQITRERDSLVKPPADAARLPFDDWAVPGVTATHDGLLAIAYRGTLYDTVRGVFDGDTLLLRSASGDRWTISEPRALGGRGDQVPNAVAAAGGREVIVGGTRRRSGGTEPLVPAAWTGSGTDWRAARVDRPAVSGKATVTMAAVTAVPAANGGPEVNAGFAAVGWWEDEQGVHPAAWGTVDGAHWSVVPADEPEPWPDTRMSAVAAGSDRLVAVGRSFGDAAVWVSGVAPPTPALPMPDVTAVLDPSTSGWSAIPDPDGAFADAHVEDVAQVGDALIAVGSDLGLRGEAGTGCRPAIWRSDDGLRWVRQAPGTVLPPVGPEVDQPTPCGSATGWRIAAGDGAVVIASGGRRTWVSPDGLAFTPVASTASGLRGDEWRKHPGRDSLMPLGITSMVATPSGFVAVGEGAYGWSQVGSPGGMSWTSRDGVAWQASPYEKDSYAGCGFETLASTAEGLVSLSARATVSGPPAGACMSSDGRRWTRSPVPALGGPEVTVSDLASGPGGLVAVGRSGDAGAIWTSPDGAGWSSVADAGLVDGAGSRVEVGTVGVSGDGWVAAGRQQTPGGRMLALWRSPDGMAWTRDDPVPAVPSTGEPIGLATMASRLVVVTDTGVIVGPGAP